MYWEAVPKTWPGGSKASMTDLWLSGVFFQALNTPKLVFDKGSAPDPAGGAYDAPPDLVVGSGGTQEGTPLPIPFTLDARSHAFGASVVRPHNTNSWLCLWSSHLRNMLGKKAKHFRKNRRKKLGKYLGKHLP